MAININPGTPLRHVSTFTSTGSFVVPAGTTLAFVSIHHATGGGGGAIGGSYPRYNGPSGAGGAGRVSGAFVEVIPGASSSVTIGAAGSAGTTGNGGNGGTTIFDGAFSAPGSVGGQAGFSQARYTTGAQGTTGAAASAATGTTTLTSLPPSASTLTRVKTIAGQATGASAGGASNNSRYGAGIIGSAGIVHVYI